MIGTRELIRSKSSMEREIFASLAMARRCSTEFVEPPVAATPVMAFSIAALVMIFEGVRSRRRSSSTNSPARRPAAAFPRICRWNAGESHGRNPQEFADQRHRVRGELSAAGASSRTSGNLKGLELSVRHPTARVFAYGFIDVLNRDGVALKLTRGNGAAI